MPIDVAQYIIIPIIADSYIRDVYHYQGRIGLLSSKGVTFSVPDSFFDFVKRRVEIVYDTDPIDLALDGDMLYMLPFDKFLIFFGRYKQHLLYWDGFFSLKTVSVTEVSQYELPAVRPVQINKSLIFADVSGQLLEFYTVMTQSVPKAFKASHCQMPDPVVKFMAMPALNLVLGFTNDRTKAWVIYTPPLDKLENLYRPISKFTFPITAEPVGEINKKFYFVHPNTDASGNLMLQLGYIDAEAIIDEYADLLTADEFIALDWWQTTGNISAACSGETIQYTAEFNLQLPDTSQTEFWLKYDENSFIFEKVLSENVVSVTSTSAILKEATYKCIYDNSSETYIIPSETTDDLAKQVYAGIPVTAKVIFEPIPIQETVLPVEKYNMITLRLLAYGLPLTIKYYKTPLDTDAYFIRELTGQILNLDAFDTWDYRTNFIKIRQPLPAKG